MKKIFSLLLKIIAGCLVFLAVAIDDFESVDLYVCVLVALLGLAYLCYMSSKLIDA